MITRARQISPEEWSQINRTVPNKYQSTLPINVDMSLALGAWAGDPGAAVSVIPPSRSSWQRANSPGVLTSMLLVCWYETEGCFKEASRQRGLPTWQAGGFVSGKLCLASPAVARGPLYICTPPADLQLYFCSLAFCLVSL